MTRHICVSRLIIGSDIGLLPGWRQAIIWTNTGILLIGHLGTNFSEILIEINTFSLKKMHLKQLSAKWHLFHLGLNKLKTWQPYHVTCSIQVQISSIMRGILVFDAWCSYVLSIGSHFQDEISISWHDFELKYKHKAKFMFITSLIDYKAEFCLE